MATALVLLVCMPGIGGAVLRRSILRLPRIQTSLAPCVPGLVTLVLVAATFAGSLAISFLVRPGLAPGLYILALGLPLFALAVLDARYYWLPDSITLPLIAIGMFAAISADEPVPALAGMLVWGGIPFGVAAVVTWLRHKPAMGLGDAKLMAAMGTWLGIDGGAFAIGFAAIGSLGYAALVVACRLTHRGRKLRIPFGTALAVSFWIMAINVLD